MRCPLQESLSSKRRCFQYDIRLANCYHRLLDYVKSQGGGFKSNPFTFNSKLSSLP